jgi:hypothetical protein
MSLHFSGAESAELSSIANQIETLSVGGILAYDTVAELQTAHPEGLSVPVWIASEGVWYYWKDSGTTPPADTTPPVLTITGSATFTNSQTVNMSTDDVTAMIYYTIDGSTPTTSSLVYSTPLVLSDTTTVKAFARDTAGNNSAIQSVTYTKQAGITTLASDSFDRADNATILGNADSGQTWAVDGVWGISGNAARVYTAGSMIHKDSSYRR